MVNIENKVLLNLTRHVYGSFNFATKDLALEKIRSLIAIINLFFFITYDSNLFNLNYNYKAFLVANRRGGLVLVASGRSVICDENDGGIFV